MKTNEQIKLCKCGHNIFTHWNDCKTLNNPIECMERNCKCKMFEEQNHSGSEFCLSDKEDENEVIWEK